MQTPDAAHLALLARIALTDEEKRRFTEEAGRILTFMGQISALDLAEVAPTTHVTGAYNVMRDDIAAASDVAITEHITAAFPDQDRGRLRVQRILDTDNAA